MKILIHSSSDITQEIVNPPEYDPSEKVDDYKTFEKEIVLYHRSPYFNGWHDNDYPDLGLHCSTEPNHRKNKGKLYAIYIKESDLKVKDVTDIDNWSSLAAFHELIKQLGIHLSEYAVTMIYRSIIAKYDRAEEVSHNIRSYLKAFCGVNALRYTDAYDDEDDTCYCLLDDIISRYEEIG